MSLKSGTLVRDISGRDWTVDRQVDDKIVHVFPCPESGLLPCVAKLMAELVVIAEPEF